MELWEILLLTAGLTWQGEGAEAGGERLAQRLQVLVEEAVAPPLLHHVAF